MSAPTRQCKDVCAGGDYVPRQGSFAPDARVLIRGDLACMSRGFTLFELMVVLVLVGIVASLALPTYRQHVLRVRRAEAMTALLDLQAAEERFYLRHNAYTADITAAPPAGLGLPASTASSQYRLSVALAADGQTFIATATPAGGQSADHDCLAFSIDSSGRRAVSGIRGVTLCWM